VTVNKERVQLLVDALRSGEYEQAQGKLRTEFGGVGYCCLGVATKIALDNGLEVENISDPNDRLQGQPWDQTYQVMCPVVADWYGFESGNPTLVGWAPSGQFVSDQAAHWNDDHGANFARIADMFENTYIREAAPV
jgi:hypothetical protein